MFMSKPSGGPDAIGGLFPIDFPSVKCMNRSGGTHIKGEVATLAFAPGLQTAQATEVATNDSNSYKPGFSNDTVWNTVVDPTSNATSNSTRIKGGLIAVCVSDSVADNTVGEYQFYGLIEAAFCVRSGGTSVRAGLPLTITGTNSFNATIGSNSVIVATFMDRATTATARTLRRVFLHNGLFPAPSGSVQV